MILIGTWIPVFRWHTGTTYILGLDECNATDKMYEFKRDILLLLKVLNVQIAT